MKTEIEGVCDEIKGFLLEKNLAYGNSAAEPVRIFSRVDAVEQLNVRIDDKLSRVARGSEYQGDDTELDLIGYLILKRAVKRKLAVKSVDLNGAGVVGMPDGRALS